MLRPGQVQVTRGEAAGCPGCSASPAAAAPPWEAEPPSPPLLADKAGEGAVIVPLSSGLQKERL